MPFDTDPDWPKELAEALTANRVAWRAKMDEVNACIQANAEQEDLVDQPLTVPGIVRVSGPFKVESIRPLEDSMIGAVLEEPIPIGGAPDVLRETFDGSDPEPEDTGWDVMNASSHIDRMIALLRHDGGSGGAGYPAVGALRDFRLESSEVVKFYVRNDHLDFSIPYEFMGVSHAFFPDFIVRLTNGVNLMLEVKGFINEQQKAKFEAAKRWCQAVTNWGKAGRWVLHVSKDPETVKLELKHLAAQ